MKKTILLLLSGLLMSSPALAQTAQESEARESGKPETAAAPAEKPVNPHFSPILPVKIHPRQTGADEISKAAADIEQENDIDPEKLGLLNTLSEGSLGAAVWQNYDPSKLVADLSKLNLNIASPVMRALLIRALLTTPSGTAATAKDAPSVMASRLETLVDLGAYDEVSVLYKKLEGNVPGPKAALAGTESMVAGGQMGLACLEEKALDADLKKIEGTSFWPDLKTFCRILLTRDTPAEEDDAMALAQSAKLYAAEKKMAAPSSIAELNSKSTIELLALNKAGMIAPSLYTPEGVRDLKPQVIALLLKQAAAGPAAKLSLLAAAVEKGMRPAEELSAEYQAQAKPAATALTGYWQAVLTSFGKVQSATPETRPAALKAVLAESKSWSNAALIPFAASFASLKTVDSFTPAEARRVVSLLIRSKTAVPGGWFAKAFDRPEARDKESVTDLEVVSALRSQPKEAPKEENDAANDSSAGKSQKSKKTPETIENPQYYAISLILGDQEVEDKSPEISYDKLFSLTGKNDYVMPSNELMNNLKQASSSQDTGKVVLYSLLVLNGQRVSQIHPAAFYRISEGLNSVGLSEENRSLAHEALADLIEY